MNRRTFLTRIFAAVPAALAVDGLVPRLKRPIDEIQPAIDILPEGSAAGLSKDEGFVARVVHELKREFGPQGWGFEACIEKVFVGGGEPPFDALVVWGEKEVDGKVLRIVAEIDKDMIMLASHDPVAFAVAEVRYHIVAAQPVKMDYSDYFGCGPKPMA